MDVQLRTWRDSAACRGLDATPFFAPSYLERREERQAREGLAKAVCSRCPVREPCLENALTTRDHHGIWGGMNEAERRRELERRRAAAVLGTV